MTIEGDSAGRSWSFDIALSFSSSDREFARSLNERLTAVGVKVFFDESYQSELWGENLYDFLQTVYHEKARFVVAIVSEAYANSVWANLERQSTQARALREVGAFLLPIRLDDSDLPGILPTIGYVDARAIGLDGITDLILQKLGVVRAERSSDPIPLTQSEVETLKRTRPPGWEWLLFAGLLAQGKMALEDKYRDHIIRLRLFSAVRIDDGKGAIAYVQSSLSQASSIVKNLERIISSEMQDRAFGPPGVAGDWDLNAYMAARFLGLYEQLLTWAADIRSADVPTEWAKAFEILASYCDQPIEAVRSTIDAFVEFARGVPAYLAKPDRTPLRVELPLKFEIDPAKSAAFSHELQNIRSSG